MRFSKMWYLATLVALAMLPLAGCGGKAASLSQGEKGVQVTVSGAVAAPKSTAKQLAAFVSSSTVQAANTINVIDAQDGTILGSGTVASDGSFSGLSFTMASSKTILVFVAKVSQGSFRSVVPIDLSNPPQAGSVSGNNAVVVNISQQTTAIADVVSQFMGLNGTLGNAGQTIAAANSDFTKVAKLVVSNGGQLLAFSGSGLNLVGSVNSGLLPARDVSTFTSADLDNIAINGTDTKITSAFIPGKRPVVNFQVVNKATGKGVSGLKTVSLMVTQLQEPTDGSNSYWLNYIDKGISLPANLKFTLSADGKTATGITKPSADAATSYNADGTVKTQGYTVIDHGDGTYTAIFGADITSNPNVPYNKALTHRIGIYISSIATPGVTATGPINPATGAVATSFNRANIATMAYDFVPEKGTMLVDTTTGKQLFARDIVDTALCNQCHVKFLANNGHFGRPDTKMCVMCHTPQNTSGEGDFTTFIHRIHMGEELPAPVDAENVVNPTKPLARTATLVTYGEQTYPQDIRNCTMCHKGADVANYYAKPSRKACGSCHNDVNFAAGHSGPLGSAGAQTDDSQCVTCHAATSAIGGDKIHLPITPPDPNSVVNAFYTTYNGNFSSYSAAVVAGATNLGNSNTNAAYTAGASLTRLPVGAKAVSYIVKSVARNTSKQPVITFKFQIATVGSNGALGAASNVVFNDKTAKSELIDGFVGSPSVYFAYAVPQDGIAAPADYNASASGYLKRIWNGTATAIDGAAKSGTITGPDSNGDYTVTLTGVTIPDNAVMLTGGLGYTYGLGSVKSKPSNAKTATDPYIPFVSNTLPLTEVDLPAYSYNASTMIGGLSIPADNKWKVATNYTGRRLIVDNAKCNACHGRLGVKPTFHAGQRNDAQTCTFCHTVNKVNSGWGVNAKEAVHAIHAGAKRVNKFSWEATAGDKYWNVTYPGYLRDCEQCHLAGMYDFSNSAYTANGGALIDSMLSTTVANGKISALATVILTGTEDLTGVTSVISPFVKSSTDVNYGAVFSADAAGVPTDAAATTLVSSPISSACFSCHDTKQAKAHMLANGGYLYEARSTALSKKETCLVCHGPAANSLNTTVPTIKNVHRWWGASL